MKSYIVFWKGNQFVVPADTTEDMMDLGMVSRARATVCGQETGGIRFHVKPDAMETMVKQALGGCITVDPETVYRGRTIALATLISEQSDLGHEIHNGLRHRWNLRRSQTRAGKVYSVVHALTALGPEMLAAYKQARRAFLDSNYMTSVKEDLSLAATQARLVIKKALKGTKEQAYLKDVMTC